MPGTSLSPSNQACSNRGSSDKTQTEKTPARPSTKWTSEEHERFLSALALYPNGSWKTVAKIVGTRTVRQVMSHAQKLAQKQQRHSRGLKPAGRPRRTTPVSPTAVEDVETATMASSPPPHRQRRLRRRNDPYERMPHSQALVKHETESHWQLHDHDIPSDEEHAGRRNEYVHDENDLAGGEHSSNSGNGCRRWSQEDLDWFAELMRTSTW